MNGHDNADVVSAWFDAHNRQDVGALLALVAPDVVVGNASEPGRAITGAAAAADFWTGMFSTFPDHRFEPTDVTSQDGRVVVEAIERGTMQGPLGGHQPSGRSFEVRAAFRFTLTDGRIHEITSYFDMGAVGRQLELVA